MKQVFPYVALAHLIVLAAAAAFGLLGGQSSPDQHIILALFALLLSCLVQVATFTYFTVTGKMMAQAVHLAGMSPAIIEEVRRLKRSMTRHLAAVVTCIVFATITGAVAWRGNNDTIWHLIAGFLLFGVHLLAYYCEFDLIDRNTRLFAETVGRYAEGRRNRPREQNP